MRIALVSREYPPETARGGIGSQNYLKAHHLSEFGHEVWIIASSVDENRHEYRDRNVHVIRIPGANARLELHTDAAEWLTYSPEAAAEVARLDRRVRLDLVEFPEWSGEGYVHLVNRTEWNRVPTIIQMHGPLVMFANTVGWPDLESTFYRVGFHMESTAVQLADAVYSSSACTARWCAAHYGRSEAEIPVIHAGVDTELFRPQPVAKSHRPTVCMAGRITPDKGVCTLVEAACIAARAIPDLRLVLLGRGGAAFVRDLRDCARAHGYPDLLETPGFIRRDELPDRFSSAHLFVLPSYHEPGPGMVYLEAMACGLPVIGCTGAGAAEVIEEGQNGYLVRPRDTEHLALTIQRALADPGVLTAVAARAREYAVRTADSRDCVRRIEAFYRTVTTRFRRAAA